MEGGAGFFVVFLNMVSLIHDFPEHAQLRQAQDGELESPGLLFVLILNWVDFGHIRLFVYLGFSDLYSEGHTVLL